MRERAGAVAAVLLCAIAMACADEPASDGPSATVAAGSPGTDGSTTTTIPTTTSTASTRTGVDREVEQAYLLSWDVYADAMLRLDASRLGEAYSGIALQTRVGEVERLSKAGTPGRMEVEHDYEVVVLKADEAFVFERYVNHSVLLNGTTMQPIEADPNEVVEREYVLRREASGWRVTHINAVS